MTGEQQPDFSFIVHSGYGNQLQSLLAAVYVANATGTGLVVPPLMSHSASPSILLKASRSCSPRIFGGNPFGVDTRKQSYAAKATSVIHDVCKRSSNESAEVVMDRWDKLFDLPAFLASYHSAGCKPSPWSCPTVDLDLHLTTPTVNGNCTKDLPCHVMIGHARSVLRTQMHSHRKTLCLGVLNDCTLQLNPSSMHLSCIAQAQLPHIYV